MAAMGRRRSTNHGLPPHMAMKGLTYYHVTVTAPRKWTSLGRDYNTALIEWAKLEGEPVPESARTFSQVAAWYRVKVMPGKAFSTQKDNERELKQLEHIFGDSPIETIEPVHVRGYLDGRQVLTGKRKGEPATVRANREVALLSHIINFARERGFTTMTNPCAGVRKHSEKGRERYLLDEEFDAIYAAGDKPMQDAMDLLSATAQRPSDVLRMAIRDVRQGFLWGRQQKTGARERIEVEGELKAVVDRIVSRPRDVVGFTLVQDAKGQPLTYWQLEDRWGAARAAAAKEMPSVADAQMRDIRGKTATDLDDLAHAQGLLNHRSRATTERYVKQRAGAKVKPHSRKRKGAA